jgi:glutathione S-transferase
MKLYYAPGACSLAPHILLRETGSAFELAHVDTTRHVLDDGTDFHTINRKGLVPVLELADGTRLTEGPVIAQTSPAPTSSVTPSRMVSGRPPLSSHGMARPS